MSGEQEKHGETVQGVLLWRTPMHLSSFFLTTALIGLGLLLAGLTGYQTTLEAPLHAYWSGEPVWWRISAGAATLLVSVYARRFVRVE